MKRVGELMLPLEAFPYIPYWFTLRQALAEMEDAEIKRTWDRTVPWIILVFGAQNQLLGIVRQRDILERLRPGSAGKLRDHFPAVRDITAEPDLYRLSFSPDRAVAELRSHVERKIIEFMTPINVTVDSNDFPLIAIYMMMDHNLTFLPVVDAGRITGIVYVLDMIREVVRHIAKVEDVPGPEPSSSG